MSETITFPDTWEEYEKLYGFTDTEEIYTNGGRLIQSFRVKQWLDHLPTADVVERKKGRWILDNSYAYIVRYICSSCCESYEVGTFMGEPIWNYCPNCGAEMRGERI